MKESIDLRQKECGEFWNKGHHEVDDHEVATLEDEKNCTKNTDHVGFIKPKDLTIKDFNCVKENLIPGITIFDIYDSVKCTIPITCRLNVGLVSKDRPDNNDYPLSEDRGNMKKGYGSGWLWRMLDLSEHFVCEDCGYFLYEDTNDFEMKCQNCDKKMIKGCWCYHCKGKAIDKRETIFWELGIRTAKHVVYDNIEAEKSTVIFFLDTLLDDDDDKTKCKKVMGGRYVQGDQDNDKSQLRFCTHDKELIDKLEKLHQERQKQDAMLEEMVKDGLKDREEGKEYTIPYVLIGYPHGAPCYVTIGKMIEKDGKGIAYDAKSCPGNSGCVGLALWKKDVDKGHGPFHSPHSKADGEDNSIGRSADDESRVVEGRIRPDNIDN